MENQFVQEIRQTPEYAAAFDMELWKAEQVRVFKAKLEREREKLRQEIGAEFAERDGTRVAELNNMRDELEEMAKQVQHSGVTLRRRVDAFEKREAAFEERRLHLARIHEENILETESKTRRIIDEMALKMESLQTQLKEKEIVVQQTLARLEVAQKEHEQLTRTMTKFHHQDGKEKVALAQALQKIEDLSKYIVELRAELNSATHRTTEAEERYQEVLKACAFYKNQAGSTVKKFNQLLKRMHYEQQQLLAQERERFTEDRKKMEKEKYETLAQERRKSGSISPPMKETWGHEVVALSYEANARDAGEVGEITQLRSLIEEIADRAERADKNARRKRQQKGRISTKQPREERILFYDPVNDCHKQRQEHHHYQHRGDVAEDVTLSSLSEGEGAHDRKEANGVPQADGEEVEDKQLPEAVEEAIQVDISADGSIGRYEVAPVETPEMHLSSGAQNKPTQEGLLREAAFWLVDPVKREEARHNALVARELGSSTVPEVANFIERLRGNRERLLATGVYIDTDNLIVEMSEKIESFERLLESLQSSE